METERVVIDTGIFIEFLRKRDKSKTLLYNLPDTIELFISSVTLYELMMGATSEEKKQDIRLLTEDLKNLSFNKDAALKASEIYHQLRTANRLIEFRDIFIAATCLIQNIRLYTLNQKDFKRINDLEFWE